tara:strand:+ start:200 stop:3670 length:3471 start_codon:yes stop_codon:yes gene_type:complete
MVDFNVEQNTEGFKNYNFLDSEEQKKENLIADQDFINDAYYFLADREGYKHSQLNTPEKVYDQFLEHFRYQNVNEVTAIRDLEYAQNANDEEKLQFKRLMSLYDNMEGDSFNLETAKDYAGGILTSPSTYLGLLTGGAGKLAATSGNALTKLAIRKLLQKGVIKSAMKGAAVEGGIGAVQSTAQELTKVETGLQKETDATDILLTTGVSAIGGGLFNAGAGFYQTKKAIDANILLSEAEKASKVLADTANKKSKDFLKNVRADEDINFLNDSLNELIPDTYKMTKAGLKRIEKKVTQDRIKKEALDPSKVAQGRNLAKQKGVDELDIDFYENLSAAALKVKSKIKGFMGKNDRITTGISKAISEGELKFNELSDILRDHNITYDQFSLIYLADISDAGRKLGIHGSLKRNIDPTVAKGKVKNLLDSIDNLEKRGLTTISKAQAKEIVKNKREFGVLKDLDRLRLALMTSQPATTMRNNANALFRVVVDSGTNAIYNVLNRRNPFDGTFDITKYMLNPYEAQAVRQIFQTNMPDQATILFRDAADLTAQAGEGALAKLGTKANFLNTMSDNFFKQAMFTAALRRRLAREGKDLVDIIKKGQFGDSRIVSKDVIEGSVQDALEFVYQKGFKGDGFFSKISKGVISAHRELPFVVSSFIPFPRFIANQMKFLYEHTPLLGMMQLEKIGTGKSVNPFKMSYDEFSKKTAQQLMGLGMFTVAYNWRKEHIDDDGRLGTYWYEFKDDTGKVVDGRPTYGPFAPYLLAADLTLRYNMSNEAGRNVELTEQGLLNPTGLFIDLYDRWGAEGKQMTEVMNSPRQYMQDALQSLAGSSFRTGYGLFVFDKLFDEAFAGGEGAATRFGAELVANIMNTYTLPVSVLKDIYSQFDKFSRYIPETRPGDPSGDISFAEILYNRGTRAFPDIGPDTVLGKYFGATEYDTPLRNPFRTGDQIALNPLEKQMFGLGKMPRLNALEKEMRALNLQYYDLYRKAPNAFVDRKIREVLSGEENYRNLNFRLGDMIENDERYLSYKSDAQKRRYLKEYMRTKIMPTVKEKALEMVEVERGDLPYSLNDLSEYRKISGEEQNAINAEFRNGLKDGSFEIDGLEDMGIKEIDSLNIENSRDLTLDIDGLKLNVLLWAISRKTTQVTGEGVFKGLGSRR